jgi:hypothetical protein
MVRRKNGTSPAPGDAVLAQTITGYSCSVFFGSAADAAKGGTALLSIKFCYR